MKINDLTHEVSLSPCADQEITWEGPQGSLTTMLCEFLSQQNLAFFVLLETELLAEKQPSPSYRALLSHVKYVTALSRIPD